MKKLFSSLGVVLALTCLAAAQPGQGLNGPHYNLNIIGVPHDKSADMNNNNGHRIFVPLDTEGRVDGNVKIYFVAGDQFDVQDANATDGDGATIAVPHGDPGTVCYEVYATALGTPGGGAHVDANVIFDGSVDDDLLTLDQVSFDAYRGNGRPVRQNISGVFRVSGCIDVDSSGTCEHGTDDIFFNNEWLFNLEQLLSYWWDYDNDGLKLLQVRFYECESSSGKTYPDGSVESSSWGRVKTIFR